MPSGLVRKVVDGGHTTFGQPKTRYEEVRVEPAGNVFVGVDMGKDAHYAQVVGPDGVEVFDRPVPNDEDAIGVLVADAAAHGDPVLVIDQPSSMAQLLLVVARELGVRVAYVTGLQMRRAADLYAGSAKTDPKDAWVLADYARRNVDRLTWLDVSNDLIVELGILNGRDVDLAHDANRAANRIRDALVSVSPALERALGDRLNHPGVRDLVAAYPTPTALRRAGRARIRTVITKRSPRTADKVASAVWKALEAQTVTLPAEDRWGQIISDLAKDLERIHSQRKNLEADIEETFFKHPLGTVLASLCGFGPRTGARALAEIGDPSRFRDGGRLAAYAGLTPVDRQSGTSIKTASKNRAGNHRLKDAMFLAAFVASQHDPAAKDYYQRKRAEGKNHNAAIICLARRRCDIIIAMLKTGTPYNPTMQPA